MFVLNNTAPPIGTVCTLTGDLSQPFTSAGTISRFATDLGTGYILTPLIQSRITTTTDDQINERTIHLEGANVTLKKEPDGPSQSMSIPFSGSVLPDSTTNVSFELMSVSSIAAFAPDVNTNVLVTANVEIYGTMGGGKISAEPFLYPITIVGEGKGVVFGLGGNGITPTSCMEANSVARTGNACNPIQDGAVDCCVRSDGLQLCPAIPETM